MPRGFRNNGKKLGFQNGHKINFGHKWTRKQRLELNRKGSKNSNWRGGKIKTHEGYIQIYSPNHPYKNNYGYILEHRLIMESMISRFLERTEIVHHINKIVDDNRECNLQLFKNASEHAKHHAKERSDAVKINKARS